MGKDNKYLRLLMDGDAISEEAWTGFVEKCGSCNRVLTRKALKKHTKRCLDVLIDYGLTRVKEILDKDFFTAYPVKYRSTEAVHLPPATAFSVIGAAAPRVTPLNGFPAPSVWAGGKKGVGLKVDAEVGWRGGVEGGAGVVIMLVIMVVPRVVPPTRGAAIPGPINTTPGGEKAAGTGKTTAATGAGKAAAGAGRIAAATGAAAMTVARSMGPPPISIGVKVAAAAAYACRNRWHRSIGGGWGAPAWPDANESTLVGWGTGGWGTSQWGTREWEDSGWTTWATGSAHKGRRRPVLRACRNHDK
ncbi:hypothetical protein DFH09DRAFT_1104170 [Mycena vulgaris]|nr:hypothetical protein DFH09DRAFT_1104170 [Mycena vulgaris]